MQRRSGEFRARAPPQPSPEDNEGGDTVGEATEGQPGRTMECIMIHSDLVGAAHREWTSRYTWMTFGLFASTVAFTFGLGFWRQWTQANTARSLDTPQEWTSSDGGPIDPEPIPLPEEGPMPIPLSNQASRFPTGTARMQALHEARATMVYRSIGTLGAPDLQ